MTTNATSAAPKAARTYACKCHECGEAFRSVKADGCFCKRACKDAYNNRAAAEAKAMWLLLKAWRQSRNIKGGRKAAKHAFAVACAAIDKSNAADKEAKRPSALAVLEGRYLAQGLKGLVDDTPLSAR